MHIRIAGNSVISVRTSRIVHGVESDGCNLALRSGSSGTLAGAAAPNTPIHPPANQAVTMRSSTVAHRPHASNHAHVFVPLGPLRCFRRAGKMPVLLQTTSPQESFVLRPRPAPAIAWEIGRAHV